MRFSEFYSILKGPDDDWFDPLLSADTRLSVDPFLIYEDQGQRWISAHDHMLNFFAIIFQLIRESKGNIEALAWKKAQYLLLFPEPAEFCLGLAEASPLGSGSGRGLQGGMLDGIRIAVGLGLENVSHMEMLGLFQGGMGLDRISDAVCNILKSYFIEYTQEVGRRHHLPMSGFKVRNAAWSEGFARWQDRIVELPANPFLAKPLPVLLTPERFLKDIPVVTADGFWRYAWQNYGAELRVNFNYDVARNVDRFTKAKLARQNPSVVESYFDKLENESHEPYPVETDPKLLVRWYETGSLLAEKLQTTFVPSAPDEFKRFIEAIITSFKHFVEQQDGWQLLWYRGTARAERAVQALFRGTVIHYCRANDVDLSGESNAGRGPVDFKFSQGWTRRALVEIKLMHNSSFWDSILAQTPQYSISEDVGAAFFVAVAYNDSEMTDIRMNKIERAAQLASSAHYSLQVIPIVVDAREKQSASKLKAKESDRKAVHDVTFTDQDIRLAGDANIDGTEE